MEDNQLIADFMGYEKNTYRNGSAEYLIPEHGVYINIQETNDEFFPGEMQYKGSWDWLMPVLRKCAETKADEYEAISIALDSLSLENVYKAVLDFIKWYNKQNIK